MTATPDSAAASTNPEGRAPLPRITVVTPSYDQARFLEATIRSVLDQNYPDLEYFIYDGGSTDGSVNIIKNYAGRLDHWESGPDGGQSAAINKGLKRATGEVVCWLNSDDVFRNDTLASVGRRFAEEPDLDLLAGQARSIGAFGRDRGDRRVHRVAGDFADILVDRRDGGFAQPATFWRRRLHETLGYLDEDLHLAMDYDFFARVVAAGGRCATTEDYLAAARSHAETKSNVGQAESVAEFFAVFVRHKYGVSGAAPAEEMKRMFGPYLAPYYDTGWWTSRLYKLLEMTGFRRY